MEYAVRSIEEREYHTHSFVFKLWGISCLSKIVSTHRLMKAFSADYYGLIVSIKRMWAGLYYMWMNYTVFILIWSIIGKYLVGGRINSGFNKRLEELSGAGMSGGQDQINFNDT
jgi:hypothetical protein